MVFGSADSTNYSTKARTANNISCSTGTTTSSKTSIATDTLNNSTITTIPSQAETREDIETTTPAAPSVTMTSTLSVEQPDKYGVVPPSPTMQASNAANAAPEVSTLECDYDINPTELYQAIEHKQWQYAQNMFTTEGRAKANPTPREQASTWVVRKETSGKLRWRLLPLHAAIIFGSPVALIELLLAEYPVAAECKDDQGMLPLHLAFRNESYWDVVEELLTHHPQAIFVKDRKGRTPLDCGLRTVSSSTSQASSTYPSTTGSSVATSQTGTKDVLAKQFKHVVSVLELYTQIAISGERQRFAAESRQMLDNRIKQLQDNHLKTLNQLKKEWQGQHDEAKLKMAKLERDMKKLNTEKLNAEADAESQRNLNKEMNKKLGQVTLALNMANEAAHKHRKLIATEESNEETLLRQNGKMKRMVEQMLNDQQAYHAQFEKLVKSYSALMEERKAVMSHFVNQTTGQSERENLHVRLLRGWLDDRKEKMESRKADLVAMKLKKAGNDDDDDSDDGTDDTSDDNDDSTDSEEEEDKAKKTKPRSPTKSKPARADVEAAKKVVAPEETARPISPPSFPFPVDNEEKKVEDDVTTPEEKDVTNVVDRIIEEKKMRFANEVAQEQHQVNQDGIGASEDDDPIMAGRNASPLFFLDPVDTSGEPKEVIDLSHISSPREIEMVSPEK